MDKKLSASLEDYLEIIYVFIEKQNSVKAINISRALQVSRASVTEALKKLNEKGLINYSRYNLISLTESGKQVALSIIEKHKILTEFFEKILKADNQSSQDHACKIEHIISQEMFDRITRFTSFYQKNVPNEIQEKFKP